jgi:adenine-specific DNA-methyltransferase
MARPRETSSAPKNPQTFRERQAFFPRPGAPENLKKSLRMEFEDTVCDHLAGTTTARFPAGEHGQIAVKVIAHAATSCGS